MVDVFYKGKTYQVPQGWAELSGAQFVEIIRVLFDAENDSLARVRLVSILMGLTDKQICKMPAETLINASRILEWIVLDSPTLGQLVPYVKVPQKLYGPKPCFENVTALEFHAADMQYMTWKDNGGDEELFHFLAILYRPAKKKYNICLNPDGDVREKFNPNLTAHYAKMLCRLDRAVIMAIVVQYESWRRNLEREYPTVFKSNASGSDSHTGWFPIFRGLAGSQKYGALEKVEQLPISTVLLELTLLIEEEAELKQRYPDLYKEK